MLHINFTVLNQPNMILTRNIHYSYTPGNSFHYPDIYCDRGNALLVTGKSGSGKTTLLHILSGLRTPDSGSVLIDGTDITQLSNRQRDLFRGRFISIIFQQSHFIKGLNVLDNILLPCYCSHVKMPEKKAIELAAQLEVSTLLNKFPHQLSQGEQQRVSIARALMISPHLIIADEPTSSLDDANAQSAITLLHSHATSHHAALIVVTHDQRVKDYIPWHIHLQ